MDSLSRQIEGGLVVVESPLDIDIDVDIDVDIRESSPSAISDIVKGKNKGINNSNSSSNSSGSRLVHSWSSSTEDWVHIAKALIALRSAIIEGGLGEEKEEAEARNNRGVGGEYSTPKVNRYVMR